jgi:hypothetical protein
LALGGACLTAIDTKQAAITDKMIFLKVSVIGW